MTPERETGAMPPPAPEVRGPAEEPEKHLWIYKLGALLFAIFCFELGTFLLVFPWLEIWGANRFLSIWPQLRPMWVSPYFRGAVSGIGLLNIYISLLEIVGLRRFSIPASQPQGGKDSVE